LAASKDTGKEMRHLCTTSAVGFNVSFVRRNASFDSRSCSGCRRGGDERREEADITFDSVVLLPASCMKSEMRGWRQRWWRKRQWWAAIP